MHFASPFASTSWSTRSRLSSSGRRGALALGLLDHPPDGAGLLLRVRERRAVERRQLEPALARVRDDLRLLFDPLLLPHTESILGFTRVVEREGSAARLSRPPAAPACPSRR